MYVNEEISLETHPHIWYFIDRLFKRHISLHTRQDLRQGIPFKTGSDGE